MAAEKAQAVAAEMVGSWSCAPIPRLPWGAAFWGKPEDADEAGAFLRLMSGRRHRVITAVAVRKGEALWTRDVVSQVRMKVPVAMRKSAAIWRRMTGRARPGAMVFRGRQGRSSRGFPGQFHGHCRAASGRNSAAFAGGGPEGLVMKGRTRSFLDQVAGREAAALIVDGTLEDLLVESDAPRPGTIYRARADRPVKGQGGMFLNGPDGNYAFCGRSKGSRRGILMLVQVSGICRAGQGHSGDDAPAVQERAM